jgi:alpha-mannosidase
VWDGACKTLIRPGRNRLSVINMSGGSGTQLASVELPGTVENAAVRDDAGHGMPVVDCVRLPGERATLVQFVAADVPAFGARTYSVVPLKKAPAAARRLSRPVIENERFRVTADEHGIVSIYDKRLKREIARPGAYRPGELAVERDTGSPWATLDADCTRMGMADWTKLAAAKAAPSWQSLAFSFDLSYFPRRAFARGWLVKGHTFVTLYAGLERIDFATVLEWDCYNGRLRVAVPVPARGKHFYGIPYGTLERKPYKGDFSHWAGANGDWPAVNWAGLQAPKFSVALLSKGLPSYKLEEDHTGSTTMWLSLLRSPAVPTYLHEPQFYSMTAYDGMRDAGGHVFEYALTAYDAPFADSSVVNDAEGYNAGLVAVPGTAHLPQAPVCESDHVRISALKCSEQGRGLVIRLWEYRGRGGEIAVRLPDGVKHVAKVNMLERRPQPLTIRNGRVSLRVRPWEIATLRAEF